MRLLKIFLSILYVTGSVCANNDVVIKPTVQKFIGEHSELDRERYFYIHSTLWDKETQKFFEEYNVNRGGRGFWSPASDAKRITNEVAKYPAGKTPVSGVKEVTRYVATDHPGNVFKDNMDSEAYGDWVVEYYQNWVKKENRPEYFEPMNEPMVHAHEFYTEEKYNSEAELRVRTRMSELYRDAGKKIKETPDLKNMKVIGFASAYPAIERKNFTHWNTSWKLFMDVAGEYVDAWCVHLYDGMNVVGTDSKRSGSNLDAILDMIETYSYELFGKVKPFAIDEYGGIEKGDYSSFFVANGQSVRAQNAILFQLLDRQDRMEISIPFTGDKSTWHLTEAYNYQPYGAVLWVDKQWYDTGGKDGMIGKGRPAKEVDEWIYTDRINFFKLWKNVKGDRVDFTTNNPDIQVQAFVDGNKMFVGLNNLDNDEQSVNLSNLGNLPNLISVQKKSVVIPNTTPMVYKEVTTKTAPENIKLAYGETVMLEYTYANPIKYVSTITQKRYYSDKFIDPISQGKPQSFSFNNVKIAKDGYASISLGIARNIEKKNGNEHSMDNIEKVEMFINSKNNSANKLTVPNNWKGDQANRDDFFGILDVKVPYNLLKNGKNEVFVEFPDAGGHISSVILNVSSIKEDTTVVVPPKPEDSVVVPPKPEDSVGSIVREIKPFNPEKVRVFPNPTKAIVNIETALDGYIMLVLPNGNKVMALRRGRNIIANIENGVYFVVIEENGEVKSATPIYKVK